MSRYVTKSFRSSGRGLDKVLGRLEREVMEALWASGGLTGREVLVEVSRSRKVALTTVLTVLERLVKKGLVRKEKGESYYVFSALYSKEEFAGMVSEEVLSGLLELWSADAVASFVDVLAKKDPTELERLSRLIASKREELGEGGERR